MNLFGKGWRSITLFQRSGFKITLDPWMIVVLIGVSWVLAQRYFPFVIQGLDASGYALIGFSAALLLLFSVFFHELGHAWIAHRMGLPAERIHLFILGGLAELKNRPITPRQETFIALAGPLFSLLLALLAYALSLQQIYHGSIFDELVDYLFWMNLLLAGFNAVPIYPLDGGRAMRGLLWAYVGHYHRASKATYRVSLDLIAVLFILGFVSWFWFETWFAFWMGLFAVYMGVTGWMAKKDLMHSPALEEMIFKLSPDEHPEQWAQHLRTSDPVLLERGLLPVLEQGIFKGVMPGARLLEHAVDATEPSTLEPLPGTYIDIHRSDSYRTDIAFNASYIPVFKNGFFLGLCDPHELRFWLHQRDVLQAELSPSLQPTYPG